MSPNELRDNARMIEMIREAAPDGEATAEVVDGLVQLLSDVRVVDFNLKPGAYRRWTPDDVRDALDGHNKPPVPFLDFVRMVGWLGHTPADLAQVLNGAGLDPKFRPGPMRGWSPGDALAEMESAFSPGELDSLRRQWAEAGRGDGMEFGR